MIRCLFFVFLLPAAAAKETRCQQTDHDTGYDEAVRIEVDEVVTQPDFHTDGQELAGHRRRRMFAEADTAQGTEGGDDKIRRIGNGPEEKDEPEIDAAVQPGQPAALIDQSLCLAPEDIAHDDKGQDIADDLTGPGNEDARQEAEQDAIDRDELDRRQAGHVGQDDEQNHEDHGNTAKRRNIRRQPRNIMARRQLP